MLSDALDDIVEANFGGEGVAVVDNRVVVWTVPAIHCRQTRKNWERVVLFKYVGEGWGGGGEGRGEGGGKEGRRGEGGGKEGGRKRRGEGKEGEGKEGGKERGKVKGRQVEGRWSRRWGRADDREGASTSPNYYLSHPIKVVPIPTTRTSSR